MQFAVKHGVIRLVALLKGPLPLVPVVACREARTPVEKSLLSMNPPKGGTITIPTLCVVGRSKTYCDLQTTIRICYRRIIYVYVVDNI